jgi:hypothetical protein
VKNIIKLTPIFPWSTHQDFNVFTSILYIVFSPCSFYAFSTSSQVHSLIITFIWKNVQSFISFCDGPINVAHHKNKNANFFMHPTTHQLNHLCKHESINLGKIVRLTPKCFSLKKKRYFFNFEIHNLFLFPWSFQHIHIKIFIRSYHVPNTFPTGSPSFCCALLDWTQNYWNQQNHTYDKRMCN